MGQRSVIDFVDFIRSEVICPGPSAKERKGPDYHVAVSGIREQVGLPHKACGRHQELSTDSIQSELEVKCPFKEIQCRPVAQVAAAHFCLIPAQTVSGSRRSA